ncbi:MAG: biotin--[acetyl-CoA-carboxylase] ligase [Oligoflexus sp.]
MTQAKLPIIVLEETDSSSSEASRLLQAGSQELPFAVLAKRQTAGRGRRGKSWQSPAGNLYLSLVLDGRYLRDQQGPLSLRVGVAIASWLRERFSIEVSLKWPNDLLFAGAKLAGILVEAISHGEQVQQVVIGMGINLRCAPDGVDQQTCSLTQIVGETELQEDLETYASQCLNYLMAALDADLWQQNYHDFAIQRGQPFQFENRFYAVDGLDPDGGLRLLPWQGTGKALVCNSIYQSVPWFYQQSERPLILIDAGNSQCKFYYFASQARVPKPKRMWAVPYQLDQLHHVLLLISQFLGEQSSDLPKPFPVFVASVNKSGFAKLQDRLTHAGLRPINLKKRPSRLDFSSYDLNQMGIDRLALCEGASLAYPQENLIVVGCGTAHTVELIDRQRVYRGGWILPGLALKWQSLAEHTDGLPAISQEEGWQQLHFHERFGHQTKQAIVRGALWESVGGLKETQRYMQQMTGESWRLIFTGGTGRLLATAAEAEFQELLIPWGMAALALGGSFPTLKL